MAGEGDEHDIMTQAEVEQVEHNKLDSVADPVTHAETKDSDGEKHELVTPAETQITDGDKRHDGERHDEVFTALETKDTDGEKKADFDKWDQLVTPTESKDTYGNLGGDGNNPDELVTCDEMKGTNGDKGIESVIHSDHQKVVWVNPVALQDISEVMNIPTFFLLFQEKPLKTHLFRCFFFYREAYMLY